MLLPALTLLLLPAPGECAPLGDLEADRAFLERELDRWVDLGACSDVPEVKRLVLRAPGIEEGAVFERRGGRWVEVASGDAPGRFGGLLRGLDEARVRWSEGVLRVEGPVGADVLLLRPDRRGVLVREGSTFLEGGSLPEGASVLEGRRVRVERYRAPVELELPFEVARESVVSVVWRRGDVRYEYSDWAAHDWERDGGRPGRTIPGPPVPVPRRRRGGRR